MGEDDGIVVVMEAKEYLYNTEETLRKRELHYGVLREPPAPYFGHQQLVLHIARLLCAHVEPRRLGRVAVAPVDVVLDAEQSLIVQPDVLFIREDRASIIRNQVWGAPDLVVEVISEGSDTHDRGKKLQWYQQYGVRECWLVDIHDYNLWLHDFTVTPAEERLATHVITVRSSVLPELEVSGHDIFLP